MKIAVLMPKNRVREMFLPKEVALELDKLGQVIWNDDDDYCPIMITAMLEDAHVCITGWGMPTLDETILQTAKHLRLVAHTGGTVAPIVSDYLFERGIRVLSGNQIYAEGVAEGTMAYILAAQRRIPQYNTRVQNHLWSSFDTPNSALLEKKVALVGFGAISRYLVAMLKPFRAKISVYDPYVSDEVCQNYGITKVDCLEELFGNNDIVSLHLPQQPETYHLVNSHLLGLMPDGALFVNTARGSCVDERALEEELISGRIRAVLDVFEEEPLPASSRLRGLDNVILIPHMAGPTHDRTVYVGLGIAKDIKNFMEGKELQLEIPRHYAVRMTK